MAALPDGFGIALDPGVRRIDDGAVVVGGSPLRMLRLNDAGRRVLDRLAAGGAVPKGASAQRLARRLLDGGLAHPRPAGGAMTAHDVTVVIPARDRERELAVTLAAIGSGSALIVVDDGSGTDATADVARARGATVLRHDRSCGAGAARNTGWREVATPLVAFVDADCEPAPGWLDPLLAHFDDAKVAAVAPRITTTSTRGLPPALAAYEQARPTLDRGPQESIVRPRSRVPFVPTAALVVRRAALAEVGGFDDDESLGCSSAMATILTRAMPRKPRASWASWSTRSLPARRPRARSRRASP